MTKTTELARFIDRFTMEYVREYPHPPDVVWDAVTTSEHLDVWLLPVSLVERALGGACSFSWGSPAAHAVSGTVAEWDPPHAVRYDLTGGGSLRFALEPTPTGTRLTFVHSFAPGTVLPPPDDMEAWGDQPAGDDVPWRPGFVTGFHLMLDHLGAFLDGSFTYDDAKVGIDTVRSGRHISESRTGEMPGEELELLHAYRAHIREACPPA